MVKADKPPQKPALRQPALNQPAVSQLGKGAPATPPVPGSADAPPVKRKLRPEAILVNVFGDLMKFSKKAPDVQAPFRKYDAFALSMAEQPREERLMMYGFLMGLALTAHARRIKDASKRRFVFETKNRLFLATANNFALRKVLNFRLCQSKRFKVVQYCDNCARKNKEEDLPARQWKFCPRCEVDRNYYNVLSMFHKHSEGGASLFLGNELIESIRGLRILKRAKYGQLGEEITFRKYTFSPKNLVALDLATVMSAAQKIADLLEKARDSEMERQVQSYAQNGGSGLRTRPPGTGPTRPLPPRAPLVAKPTFAPRPAAPPVPTFPRGSGSLASIPGLVLKPKASPPPTGGVAGAPDERPGKPTPSVSQEADSGAAAPKKPDEAPK
ncbi:MAG: hypothetical protein IOD12_10670 [Silvanigrellales bacterium]|jgi:hypothetical protein|nr:hypothetical protein [Silvanigrellales bacterium]